jgi:hypothetical protein
VAPTDYEQEAQHRLTAEGAPRVSRCLEYSGGGRVLPTALYRAMMSLARALYPTGLFHGCRIVASLHKPQEAFVPASVTQILVIVVCLVVIAAAVYFRGTFKRKVYNQMQQSNKPKSKIQKFLGW